MRRYALYNNERVSGQTPRDSELEVETEHKRGVSSQPEEADCDYVCAKCSGTNVETVCWVDANTNQVLDDYGSWNELETTWCRDCHDHTGIITRAEYQDSNGD